MTRIIGIDPGLHRTGFGIIERDGNSLIYVHSGVIVTDPKSSLANRLVLIHERLITILDEFAPKEGAIEETYVNVNAASSLKLGHARGAIMLTLGIKNIIINEYSPRTIKKTITGYGASEKEQIFAAIKLYLPKASPKSPDEADALATAICHGSSNKIYDMLS